jgi:4,5-DOPA dioxygenase extradiol
MTTLPSLFISHGAPTFALEPGRAGAQLASVARSLPRPQAILIVSAHWMTREARVGTSAAPRTIHDFGGFGEALHRLQYPAPGHPVLAARTIELLRATGWAAEADAERGLDHGAWVPLMHLYPQANVPVFQVSMPMYLDSNSALAFGATLAPLAAEGVLIVGSGSLTHNLYEVEMGSPRAATYAAEFTTWIRDAVVAGDRDRLQRALTAAPHAQRAHPTAEHFLPLLVAAGAARKAQRVTVLDGGIVHKVLAMESYVFGRELDVGLTAKATAEAV